MKGELGLKEELIKEIFLIEWDMFKKVSNVGGEASCQQNQKTFMIMRVSQAMSWTEPMLESYLEDLKSAKKEGRNLMTEKYAHMMKSTFPEEYKEIAHRLPIISEDAISLVERITSMMVQWAKEMKKKYPNVVATGRPIERKGDNAYDTSLETYSRGELLTYGISTLQLSWDYFSKCLAEGLNNYEAVLTNMVKLYGYDSIQRAEENNIIKLSQI